jgi:hypothetical protein
MCWYDELSPTLNAPLARRLTRTALFAFVWYQAAPLFMELGVPAFWVSFATMSSALPFYYFPFAILCLFFLFRSNLTPPRSLPMDSSDHWTASTFSWSN